MKGKHPCCFRADRKPVAFIRYGNLCYLLKYVCPIKIIKMLRKYNITYFRNFKLRKCKYKLVDFAVFYNYN